MYCRLVCWTGEAWWGEERNNNIIFMKCLIYFLLFKRGVENYFAVRWEIHALKNAGTLRRWDFCKARNAMQTLWNNEALMRWDFKALRRNALTINKSRPLSLLFPLGVTKFYRNIYPFIHLISIFKRKLILQISLKHFLFVYVFQAKSFIVC